MDEITPLTKPRDRTTTANRSLPTVSPFHPNHYPTHLVKFPVLPQIKLQQPIASPKKAPCPAEAMRKLRTQSPQQIQAIARLKRTDAAIAPAALRQLPETVHNSNKPRKSRQSNQLLSKELSFPREK